MSTLAPSNKPRVQMFPEIGASVRITKGTGNGTRFAHITRPSGTVAVPVELLGLAAGRDAWMRGIEVKCLDCGTWTKASEMECELCPGCLDKAMDENDRLDGRS